MGSKEMKKGGFCIWQLQRKENKEPAYTGLNGICKANKNWKKESKGQELSIPLVGVRRRIADAITNRIRAKVWNQGTWMDTPPMCDIQFTYKGKDYDMLMAEIPPSDSAHTEEDIIPENDDIIVKVAETKEEEEAIHQAHNDYLKGNDLATGLQVVSKSIGKVIRQSIRADVWNEGMLCDPEDPMCDIQFRLKDIDYNIQISNVDEKHHAYMALSEISADAWDKIARK
tara:strand:- start:299 stop:982 length:684 start_codon:yes stop_codon:yes gene_type:complete